jgi:hypothetical protein
MTSSVTERFLRYVAIDTQSDPHSKAQPSTEKQKDLSRLLVGELLAIGIADAHMDEHGNVCDRPGQYGQGRAGHLLVLACRHRAGFYRQGRQAADRQGLSGR